MSKVRNASRKPPSPRLLILLVSCPCAANDVPMRAGEKGDKRRRAVSTAPRTGPTRQLSFAADHKNKADNCGSADARPEESKAAHFDACGACT